MIDIHCHILPGVDDGPANLEQAMAMAKVARADGISSIIATPHVADDCLSREEIIWHTTELNLALQDRGIGLTVYPGAEVSVHCDPDKWAAYTLGDSPYLLIEFPHCHFPSMAASLLKYALDRRLRPIIAHPERNPGILRNPHLLEPLLAMGSSVQLTADSITGALGPAVRQCAHYLLRRHLVQFIATDSHAATVRPPLLAAGLKTAGKVLGKGGDQTLFMRNAAAILALRPA